MRIVVDGYNLLFRLGFLQGGDLEGARKKLLGMLSNYGKVKRYPILVVFDGQKVAPGGHVAKKWVKAIFTSPPESADDRIAKLAESEGERVFVVTSDRELLSRVSPFNCPHISVDDFVAKVEQAHYLSIKGDNGNDEEKKKKPKKGASRRLSKKKRRQKHYRDKL